MNVDLIPLPAQARCGQLADHGCAVFDVLRATTTITAALAAGVGEIHLFDSLDAAREAAAHYPSPRLLCGERDCLAPPGFELGNSPGQFCSDHRGATLFMCTTNGTRALLAAREASLILPAALVNAAAVADALARHGRDVVLLCAGTNGQVADEDLFGAGAVIEELSRRANVLELTEPARSAWTLFREGDAIEVLRKSRGGRNVLAAGLDADIRFSARLNVFDVVGVASGASGDPLIIRPYTPF